MTWPRWFVWMLICLTRSISAGDCCVPLLRESLVVISFVLTISISFTSRITRALIVVSADIVFVFRNSITCRVSL